MSVKKTTGTIRFELRKGVSAKSNQLPISLIYSLMGNRKRYSLDRTILKDYWNATDQRAFYIPQREAKKLLNHLPTNQLLTELEINELNDVLDNAETDIKAIEDKFKALETPFSSEMVINELLNSKLGITKVEEKKGLVFDFIDKYIEDNESIKEAGSLTVYKSVRNHLKAYEVAKKAKVKFENIDYDFFIKFQNFLIKRTKTDKDGIESPLLNNITIAKVIRIFKSFLIYARKKGIKINDNYRDFSCSFNNDELEVIALEQDELQSLIDFDFSNNKRLDRARDLFLFACSTGLRFSDVQLLKGENITNDRIKIVVKKTNTPLTIPLNEISANILDKYKELKDPLPSISNQKINKYIKEVCELAGITKPTEIVRYYGKDRVSNTYPKHELISFHTGRKTFITLSLERGMSAEEVKKISSHRDHKSFTRYINITESRKKVVMLKAWGAPKERNLKVV